MSDLDAKITNDAHLYEFISSKPRPVITFHDKDGAKIGELDFSGAKMKFSGDAEESANVFFDFVARSFAARLEEERERGRNEK